jgi:hypothetical protein
MNYEGRSSGDADAFRRSLTNGPVREWRYAPAINDHLITVGSYN